ncbi:Uma2 family endonuclease [Leptolyngbya sp. FACHB-671]|uniref:Uma2 family endonuclease n=1 Tax=Leptolyngbya sp. FACHB-671 TaxID=2692812 RepID=UPI0016878E9F|nr:Uma2 family endonuclease [Leptolyngbya sp. FACHB-671]MBD2066189.1 Uma2 family endonuclease [Leptolyngbya sp. FACHB-671]
MTAQLTQPPKQRATDQRIILQGTWEKFKLLQQASEDSPGVRLAYYSETIEILMPGEDHEFFAHIIGYLLTTFLLDMSIDFKPTGSKNQDKEGTASAQADQSYCIGGSKPIPDLSIEVIFTSGINKLARYQALGVPEVWFWQDGVLTLYHLRPTGYEQIDRSELAGLNQLDIDLLKRCILMAETNFSGAVQTLRQSSDK